MKGGLLSWQGSEAAFVREVDRQVFLPARPSFFLSIRTGGYCQLSGDVINLKRKSFKFTP